MANAHQPIQTTSIKAAAVLPNGRFVDFSGGLCAVGDRALGVCAAETAKDEQAPINTFGICLVEAGGAVAVEDQVGSDATGRAVPRLTAVSNGVALDAAAAAGAFIRIRLPG